MRNCLVAIATFTIAIALLGTPDQSGSRLLSVEESTELYGGIDLCLQYKPKNMWECNSACCSYANMATYDSGQSVTTYESFSNVLCDVFKPNCHYYWQNDFTGCAGG